MDVWFLGDSFLKENFTSFQAVKTRAIKENASPPYLFDYYNVYPLYQNPVSSTRPRLTRIINALLDKLNEEEKLPRYIIIILDKDIIEEAFFYDFGVKYILKNLITWIQRNIDLCIETCKEDIRGKRPGSLTSAIEPRYIWVTPLHRPPNLAKKSIFSLVNKCKETMEYIMAREQHCHIMTIKSVNEYAHFDHWGSLTSIGKEQLWKELDQQMRRFDRSDLDLLPEGVAKLDGKQNSKPECHSSREDADIQHSRTAKKGSSHHESSEERILEHEAVYKDRRGDGKIRDSYRLHRNQMDSVPSQTDQSRFIKY